MEEGKPGIWEKNTTLNLKPGIYIAGDILHMTATGTVPTLPQAVPYFILCSNLPVIKYILWSALKLAFLSLLCFSCHKITLSSVLCKAWVSADLFVVFYVMYFLKLLLCYLPLRFELWYPCCRLLRTLSSIWYNVVLRGWPYGYSLVDPKCIVNFRTDAPFTPKLKHI